MLDLLRLHFGREEVSRLVLRSAFITEADEGIITLECLNRKVDGRRTCFDSKFGHHSFGSKRKKLLLSSSWWKGLALSLLGSLSSDLGEACRLFLLQLAAFAFEVLGNDQLLFFTCHPMVVQHF